MTPDIVAHVDRCIPRHDGGYMVVVTTPGGKEIGAASSEEITPGARVIVRDGAVVPRCGQSLWHGFIAPEKKRVLLPDILADVAERYGVSVEALKGPSRARSIVWPRQEAMWLARRHTRMSYPEIGRRLGGRDHTTVMHGERQHAKRISEGQGQ